MEDTDGQSPAVAHGNEVPGARALDPSDAVTGVGILFGVIGGAAGVVATLLLSDAPSVGAWLAYCLIAALAGGSAGVVIGGMVGAIFGVIRGVVIPARSDHDG